MPIRQSKPRRHATDRRSLASDSLAHLRDAIRAARTQQHFTQQALATKLGIRQRQISDLERSTIDPRLSTLENVARALDLELMLVPRPLISTVEAIVRTGTDDFARPLYALDEEEQDDTDGGDR